MPFFGKCKNCSIDFKRYVRINVIPKFCGLKCSSIFNREKKLLVRCEMVEKKCTKCKEIKSISDFHKSKKYESAFFPQCKKCCVARIAAHRKVNPIYHMWIQVKLRAKRNNIPFDIEQSDISISEFCPLLNIPLNKPQSGKLTWNSPSIDRKIPSLGYIKGNTWIISHRANTLKNNAKLDELILLIDNLKKLNIGE